jgi:hypothetical protein
MKALNYDNLMAQNPTKYGQMTNSKGQSMTFFEHPTFGEEYPVIVVFTKERKAFCSDFFDTSDMWKGSDYEPVLKADGTCCCAFEL